MERERVSIILAAVGFAAILVGIHQGLVHVAPGYEGTITSGWGGPLNHEERLLAALGAVGVVGTVATRRWKRLAVVPVATGGVVLFYALRAMFQTAQNLTLYAETTTYDGTPVAFVLGVEPVLLVAGGFLLVGAGIESWRWKGRENRCGESPQSPTA
jgi:hypothetical protein